VGLKTIEYGQWLLASCVGSAGRPHKHAQLREVGAEGTCSSRDGSVFAMGAARLLGSGRAHAALNSLSLDFIPVSLAVLGEGGALEEIGKRSIWALARHAASAPSTAYCAVAIDADMARDPLWMHGVLSLLENRAGMGAVTSLPLRSFAMETQYELAFRTLQGGLNMGKVVLRVGTRTATRLAGTHLVTGGTGGIGLLTGRWLAQCGASHLVLASRSGSLARGTMAEWKAVEASGAAASVERCDTSELVDLHRSVACVFPLVGAWHAAGVLADAVLAKVDASALARVYAPKAVGAHGLHLATAASGVSASALF
jgi:NADPH:quinone reductase-like Zn-dependent oxidoreductase